MLWRVENSNLWLLGSVHAMREPPQLFEMEQQAIDKAEVFAFEANFEAYKAPQSLLINPNGRALADVIPAPLLARATALWDQLGLPANDLILRRPWSAAVTLTNRLVARRGFDTRNGVDRLVLRVAKRTHGRIFFLEQQQAGIEVWANAPPIEQEAMLCRIVDETEAALQGVETLVSAWRGRITHPALGVIELLQSKTPQIAEALLSRRNKNWLPHLLRLARSGRHTVATMGMLHFLGEDSIPMLLAGKGYPCQPLTVECS